MKQSIAVFFVEKLRSGEYKQTKGGLRNDDCFCALGVLCDISGLGTWEKQKRTPYDRWQIYSFKSKASECLGALPHDISEWAGLSMHEEDVISKMNDGGASFEVIADYVEKNWEKL